MFFWFADARRSKCGQETPVVRCANNVTEDCAHRFSALQPSCPQSRTTKGPMNLCGEARPLDTLPTQTAKQNRRFHDQNKRCMEGIKQSRSQQQQCDSNKPRETTPWTIGFAKHLAREGTTRGRNQERKEPCCCSARGCTSSKDLGDVPQPSLSRLPFLALCPRHRLSSCVFVEPSFSLTPHSLETLLAV